MHYAIVSVAGLLAGSAELYLLSRFVKALFYSDTRRVILLLPTKFLILVALFLPTILIVPDLLWLAGCAAVMPLLVGGGYAGYKTLWGKREAKQ